MTRREQLHPRIAELRDEQGLMWKEIGVELGLSPKTVQEYYADPTGEQTRARKARYGGTCEDCGAATTGGGGKANAPKRCGSCSRQHQRRWDRKKIIAAIQAFAAEHGRQPASTDLNPARARNLGHIGRGHGVPEKYPHSFTVCRIFGTWNAAIEAAGFEPVPQGSGPKTRWHTLRLRQGEARRAA